MLLGFGSGLLEIGMLFGLGSGLFGLFDVDGGSDMTMVALSADAPRSAGILDDDETSRSAASMPLRNNRGWSQ